MKRITTVIGPLAATLLLVVMLLLPATDASALGIPLRPLNVQVQSTTRVAVDVEPGLLTPTGMAVWFARQLITPPSLDEVVWTAPSETTVKRLSIVWGIDDDEILRLNPELTEDSVVGAGREIVVYRSDAENPTQSVGRPNRGRLINGIPVPEGPFWKLRDSRHRHYGTRLTVFTLTHALTEYGKRFPEGPRVRIGELADKNGGKVRPHRSHRTGRDADIGYITTEDDGTGHWNHPRRSNLDAEKTWFFVKSMLETGNVQAIYMDRGLQRVLSRQAEKEGLSDEELAQIFEYPRRPNSHRAIIQHWRGHARHMHIRFRCESWNARCKPW